MLELCPGTHESARLALIKRVKKLHRGDKMDKVENDDKTIDKFKTFKTKGRPESRLAGGRRGGG